MDGAFLAQGQDFGDGDGGGGGRGGGRSGFRGTAENAKTKLCNRWMQGECRFGDRCNFAHGENELRQSHDHVDSQQGGRGYGGPQRGRAYGYGGGAAAPGRGYGGGYPMGGYQQGGYGLEQPQGGFDQRPGGAPDDPWNAQGCPVNGPNGWCMYRAKDTGEYYYHNHKTQLTQWDRPAEWAGPM